MECIHARKDEVRKKDTQKGRAKSWRVVKNWSPPPGVTRQAPGGLLVGGGVCSPGSAAAGAWEVCVDVRVL